MRIIESHHLTEQFRFPRSKKKRIRAKWSKRPENSRPARKAVVMGDTLICHPTMAKQLRMQVAEMDEESKLLDSIFGPNP